MAYESEAARRYLQQQAVRQQQQQALQLQQQQQQLAYQQRYLEAQQVKRESAKLKKERKHQLQQVVAAHAALMGAQPNGASPSSMAQVQAAALHEQQRARAVARQQAAAAQLAVEDDGGEFEEDEVRHIRAISPLPGADPCKGTCMWPQDSLCCA
jgi:hypothetical protein